MDVCENSKNSNGCVFLLVHNVVDEGNHDLGEHFQNLLRFKVLCVACNDHSKSFTNKFVVLIGVISLSEVDWQPVSEPFVVGGPCYGLFVESLNRYVVKHSLSLPDGTCSGQLGDFESDTKLILLEVKLGVVASELLVD